MWKTEFRVEDGLFEWNKMPMGLCQASATFQRIVNSITKDFSRFVRIYQDDFIIFQYHQSHQDQVVKLLNRLKSYGLSPNWKKCLFFGYEILESRKAIMSRFVFFGE